MNIEELKKEITEMIDKIENMSLLENLRRLIELFLTAK